MVRGARAPRLPIAAPRRNALWWKKFVIARARSPAREARALPRRSLRPVVIAICGLSVIVSPVLAEKAKLSGGEMDAVAEAYVKLVLAIGQHDADYVDAYYGPAQWKDAAAKEKKSLDAIGAEAKQLVDTLQKIPAPAEEMKRLRREYLTKQLRALETYLRIVKGERLKFDEESRLLYDAVAPTFSDSHFQKTSGRTREEDPGLRTAHATLRTVAQIVCDSEGETRYRLPTRDQRMPPAHARAHQAPA